MKKKLHNQIKYCCRNFEFNRWQQGQGLKILTPNQMLIRLPITLAQLKAGNNSEKLKNEIRQLLYSLYRLQKLSILSIYYTQKNIRSEYSNNKFKISAPT